MDEAIKKEEEKQDAGGRNGFLPADMAQGLRSLSLGCAERCAEIYRTEPPRAPFFGELSS